MREAGCHQVEAPGSFFYAERHELSVDAARAVLGLLLQRVEGIRSVLDLGCGVGTWLAVCVERGIEDIMGLDGPWVDEQHLIIDPGAFISHDLRRGFPPIARRYDLAICLEVAEHLPEDMAHGLIEFLTTVSDVVLFSAAVPGQGGENHINEQWPDYWAARFRPHGYQVYDIIRPLVWENTQIPVWYRQNCLLFADPARVDLEKQDESIRPCSGPLSIVHPELFERSGRRITSLQRKLAASHRGLHPSPIRNFFPRLVRYIQRFMGANKQNEFDE